MGHPIRKFLLKNGIGSPSQASTTLDTLLAAGKTTTVYSPSSEMTTFQIADESQPRWGSFAVFGRNRTNLTGDLFLSMDKFLFSGHETFTCRLFWLKKGYDFLKKGHSFSAPDAVVHLGVGKNMVPSIQFWMKAFSLLDEKGVTDIACNILDNEGLDPYLENSVSYWVLHEALVHDNIATSYNLLFDRLRRERQEFTYTHFARLVAKRCEEVGVRPPAEKTLRTDFNVLIRSYVASEPSRNLEDDLSTFLTQLDLIRKAPEKTPDGEDIYRFNIQDRYEFPIGLGMYYLLSLLDEQSSISFDTVEDWFTNALLMTRSGIYDLIQRITTEYKYVTFTEDAGVREIQVKFNRDRFLPLKAAYESR